MFRYTRSCDDGPGITRGHFLFLSKHQGFPLKKIYLYGIMHSSSCVQKRKRKEKEKNE